MRSKEKLECVSDTRPTIRRPIFPNLFIVGAMKAGTSSLHEYLHQHPQIFMSRFKEPQYFAPHRTQYGMWGQGQALPERGIDWYLQLFADSGDVKCAGESSVSYTARHWIGGCEQRIWEFNPDARIIYLMRDPVERAISHYWHFVAAGRETLPPLAAVKRRDDYIARSDYAYQIEPYIRRFGEGRVFLLTLEALRENPQETFRRLFRWLDVEESVTIDVSERFNVREQNLFQTRRYARPLARFLQGWRWQKWKRISPIWLSGALESVAYRPVDRNEVDLRPTLEYLRGRLRPTVSRLAELAGRQFPEWTTMHVGGGACAPASDSFTACVYRSHIDWVC